MFIYCGTVLENDNQTLDGYKVRAETMIQVFPKQHDMEYKSEPATNDQINAAVVSYRGTFKEMANSSTTVNSICIAFNVMVRLHFWHFYFVENHSARNNQANIGGLSGISHKSWCLCHFT